MSFAGHIAAPGLELCAPGNTVAAIPFSIFCIIILSGIGRFVVHLAVGFFFDVADLCLQNFDQLIGSTGGVPVHRACKTVPFVPAANFVETDGVFFCRHHAAVALIGGSGGVSFD